MKVFIWEMVSHCTTNYHDGGGVLVVAETLDKAREFFRKDNAYVPTLEKCEVFTREPDHIIKALY